MNSLLTGIVRALLGFLTNTGSSNTESTGQNAAPAHPEPRPGKRQEKHSTSHTPTPTPRPQQSQPRGNAHRYEDPATSNRPHTSIREASIADALAHASYQPIMDGDADPGEVVWTWVPYQEDASVGKDRPAVVIGAQGEGVYLLQLTSKDHTREAAQEAAAGRYWFDIGTGAWDSKGRPSEVRLDRALWVKATDVRREGSILPEVTWRRIVDALEEHYRTHGE
ncbi:type II toxin-antitoxin system PemK/MazF family toxin [uncultured Actinomyces sp.]|uniref:type II toxin-antitoxin system PemK/MazF family toxin n=1 Tax=uncultured Actinomyces sp. TaxID=249061 RepID=UPI0028F14EFA|nr:type II toxin-antitoxin system PemK/MazF family toxin [uncultured Actinomyces sp.]